MTARLRVATVSRWYPRPGDPFSGSFVRDTVRAVEPECDVTVVVPQTSDARDVAAFVRSPPRAGDPWNVPMPGWPLSLPVRAVVLDRALGRLRPDLIHLHLALPDGLPAVVTGRLRRVPVVVSEHAGFLGELAASARSRFGLVQTLRHADAVVVGSEALAGELRAYEPRARVHVIGNPVDTAVFAPDASTRELALSACLALGEAKGTDVLLEAWARASVQASLPRLVLVGGGPDLDRFRGLARSLGLEGVEFAGVQPRDQLAALMRRASFFVSASRNERFALVVAEAIASGTPVVSTRVGGPEEYVTSETGVLVEPNDIDGLAAAVVRMSGEANRYDADALHRSIHERYGYERFGQRLVGVYRSLTR